jgi:hypothetical protein
VPCHLVELRRPAAAKFEDGEPATALRSCHTLRVDENSLRRFERQHTQRRHASCSRRGINTNLVFIVVRCCIGLMLFLVRAKLDSTLKAKTPGTDF